MAELVEIESLPDLNLICRRWAVTAALSAAVLGPSRTRAEPHGGYFDDGGGSWSQLILLSEGRSVLVGMDRESSDTFRDGIELRDGLPFWSLPFLPAPGPDGERPWWGFVALFDRTTWWAPELGVEDGLADHPLPVLSEDEMVDAAADWLDGASQEGILVEGVPDVGIDPDALRRAVDLGPHLTTSALFDLLPVDDRSLAAGVAAAHEFQAVTPVPVGARELPYPVGSDRFRSR